MQQPTPEMISSLLAAMAGAMLAFSLVTEARALIRAGGPWRVLPVPPLEVAAYAVMTLSVAAPHRGPAALMTSAFIVPLMMLAFRFVWMLGRRAESDPIRQALERWESRRQGRDVP